MNQTKKYSHKQGMPPGSLVHTGKVYELQTSIEFFCYDENNFTITESNNIQDILNTHHLPKFEDYGEHVFFTLKDLSLKDADNIVTKKQLSFILGNHYLISFEEHKSELFAPIVNRIKSHKGKVRMMQNDYLLYALTDVITDNYLRIIDNMDDDMEAIEEELLNNRSKLVLNKILFKRKQHLSLKKSVIPVLEETRKLHHSESPLINEKTYIYFQDIIDHLSQVTQNLDTFREMISNLSELYLANNDIQMNDVMKRLTVVSTIFIPLTFIVGLYGMNFKYFPELQWQYGYLYIWVFMVLLSIGMVIYLKKRQWF